MGLPNIPKEDVEFSLGGAFLGHLLEDYSPADRWWMRAAKCAFNFAVILSAVQVYKWMGLGKHSLEQRTLAPAAHGDTTSFVEQPGEATEAVSGEGLAGKGAGPKQNSNTHANRIIGARVHVCTRVGPF